MSVRVPDRSRSKADFMHNALYRELIGPINVYKNRR